MKCFACKKKINKIYQSRAADEDSDLGFGDFVSGQLHHCKVSFPQGADNLIEADLQRPPLGRRRRRRLGAPAGVCHDHHGASTAGTALG